MPGPRLSRRPSSGSGRYRDVALVTTAALLAGIGLAALGSDVALAETPPNGTKSTVDGAISARSTGGAAATSGQAIVTGSGFGHGIGLSQFGAYGMALAGKSATEIIAHYFTGVTIAGVNDSMDIRVNVVHGGKSIVLRPIAISGGAAQLRLKPATGTALLIGTGDTVTVTPSGSQVKATVRRGTSTSAAQTATSAGWTAEWTGTKAWSGVAARLGMTAKIGGSSKVRSYRWGRLAILNRSGSLEGVTSVDLHSGYLRGIAEVPTSWPAAALQAQVITARSYALVAVAKAPRADCGGCQVWDDQRSQVYSGWSQEGGYDGDRWVAAVSATSPTSTTGTTVLYKGKPAETYYASSTGGATRDPKLVWGSSVPYLRSVPDPWSLDPAVNPKYAAWSRSISVKTLLSAFGITDGSGLASVRVTSKDSAGAALVVTAQSGKGTVKTLSGEKFRSRLGMPSSWVTKVTLPS